PAGTRERQGRPGATAEVQAAGVTVHRRWSAGLGVDEEPRQRVRLRTPLALELERAGIAKRAPEVERPVTFAAPEPDDFPVQDEVRTEGERLAQRGHPGDHDRVTEEHA